MAIIAKPNGSIELVPAHLVILDRFNIYVDQPLGAQFKRGIVYYRYGNKGNAQVFDESWIDLNMTNQKLFQGELYERINE